MRARQAADAAREPRRQALPAAAGRWRRRALPQSRCFRIVARRRFPKYCTTRDGGVPVPAWGAGLPRDNMASSAPWHSSCGTARGVPRAPPGAAPGDGSPGCAAGVPSGAAAATLSGSVRAGMSRPAAATLSGAAGAGQAESASGTAGRRSACVPSADWPDVRRAGTVARSGKRPRQSGSCTDGGFRLRGRTPAGCGGAPQWGRARTAARDAERVPGGSLPGCGRTGPKAIPLSFFYRVCWPTQSPDLPMHSPGAGEEGLPRFFPAAARFPSRVPAFPGVSALFGESLLFIIIGCRGVVCQTLHADKKSTPRRAYRKSN